ncbi:MAG TPA: hypothetical protein VK203_19755 [Nostocaceae cyanobacterium]|nr:hypothetical protein [Nostocaceae cyanobacterium]
MTGTLSLVLPVAVSATKLILDEKTYKGFEDELDLGLKSVESISKSSDIVTQLADQKEFNQIEDQAIRAQGFILRELHAIFQEKVLVLAV